MLFLRKGPLLRTNLRFVVLGMNVFVISGVESGKTKVFSVDIGRNKSPRKENKLITKNITIPGGIFT